MRQMAVVLIATLMASAAQAGWVNNKRIKAWPADDQLIAHTVDYWMNVDQLKLFERLTTSSERRQFIETNGIGPQFDALSSAVNEAVKSNMVQVGLTEDETKVVWHKPNRVKEELAGSTMVTVYYYEFERDRKGHAFRLIPGSRTADTNEVFMRFVIFHEGKVVRVAEQTERRAALAEVGVLIGS